jgi:hypothetical protein
VVAVGDDAEGVDAITVQAAGEEPADERDRAQGVVAEHVGHDVPDPPLRAQTWRVPLLRLQCDEQVCQIRSLCAGERHGVHDRSHPAFAALFA